MDARTTTTRAAVDAFSGALTEKGRACTAARIAVNAFCLEPSAQNRQRVLAALDQVETTTMAVAAAQLAARQ